MGSITPHRPHVVCLGAPQYIGKDYLAEFTKDFDFEVLDATDRTQATSRLPELIKRNGPVEAFIVRMGTPPYEPFDFFGPLVPSCKIITSASAGYNEFDIDWMSKNGITFCNSVDAVAEATADMAIFLILATLRNTTMAEKSVKAGKWRSGAGLVPATDPSGLTLGIVGMGSIGKVSSNFLLEKQWVLLTHSSSVSCKEGHGVQHEDQILQSSPPVRERRVAIQRHVLLLPP
jgi:lactate dehydrogenase-like 2-hydroxyacid dehydrogenase